MAEPSHKLRDDQSGQNATPSFIKQAAKYLTAGAAGTALLGMSALTLALTVVGLAVATPVLLVLSPVLVPAVAVVLIACSGFVLSGGFGMAALSSLAWIYNYLAGKRPIGSEKVDMLREKLARTTQAFKEKAEYYGHYAQHKTQEVTGSY